MTKSEKQRPAKGKSFIAKYKARFNVDRDEWILQVPGQAVKQISSNLYEIHLPVYASRALSVGGNTLRRLRREYRAWLLEKQGGRCAICGIGTKQGDPWNLDHQPPLAEKGSKFIDYKGKTQNRVIHRQCDSAQKPKK